MPRWLKVMIGLYFMFLVWNGWSYYKDVVWLGKDADPYTMTTEIDEAAHPNDEPVRQPGKIEPQDRELSSHTPAGGEEAESPAKAPALAQWSQLTSDIQNILMSLGYNPGAVDGIYGERTRVAIEAFQQDIGIPVDGQISQQLLHTLQQSLRIGQIFDEMLDVDTNDNAQSTTSEEVRITDTAPATQKSPSNLTYSQEEYFTRGSHENDVLRLQGTPSSINRYSNSKTWRFGISTVEIDLRTQRVLEWSNVGGNLKVRLLPGNQVTSETYFTRGSHEDDVLRLQGTPSSINRYSNSKTWRFGISTVEIDLRTQRVLEWSNIGGNLKVKL